LKIIQEGGDVFRQTRTGAEQYASEIDRLNYLLAYGAVNQDSYNRAVESAKGKISDTTSEMSEFAKTAAGNIQNALGDQLYNMMTGKFDDIGTAWMELIAKMSSQAMAAQLAKSLFGDYGSKSDQLGGLAGMVMKAISSSGSGISLAPATTTSVSAIGGMMAAGGPVIAHKTYLVGERGPELFMPKDHGTIIPNHAFAPFTFGGMRAAGGPVKRDSVYVVGERGPELYLPSPGKMQASSPGPSAQSKPPNFNVTIKHDPSLKIEQETTDTKFDGEAYHASVSLRLMKSNQRYRESMKEYLQR
jgi:hypothetical protein